MIAPIKRQITQIILSGYLICLIGFLFFIIKGGIFVAPYYSYAQEGEGNMEIESVLNRITWLGHSSFRIHTSAGEIIYIDPWKINNKIKADIILVTHEHYDHLSTDDIENLQKQDTVIITIPLCASKLAKNKNVRTIKPKEKMEFNWGVVEAVPAYNIKKPFHPKQDGRAGFIITIEGIRIYHAGDTDLIPEMDGIKADIALLPVSGTYVMNSKEAAEAAKIINPAIAVPMHYGDPEVAGTAKDAQDFKHLLKDSIDVRILPISK